MNTKVAIIMPTLNRPDFVLRQLEFYELMNSPHPVYISDSSIPEYAEKLKSGIKKFNKLKIVYRWDPPGKDYTINLFQYINEKYCMLVNDDDIMIPQTVSECADFLESHPDYATCIGKQVNFHFRQEDFNKPFGIVQSQTRPMGNSIEDENMLVRAQKLWSDQDAPVICFAVRRVEVERKIRSITRNYSMLEDMFEFVLFNILIIAGKSKTLDKISYVMQRSIVRTFDHGLLYDFMSFPQLNEQWGQCAEAFTEIVSRKGISKEESYNIVKCLFIIYLAHHFPVNRWMSAGQEKYSLAEKPARRKSVKKFRKFISQAPFIRTIYHKFHPPTIDVINPESKYYSDFKPVKDFLENKKPIV